MDPIGSFLKLLSKFWGINLDKVPSGKNWAKYTPKKAPIKPTDAPANPINVPIELLVVSPAAPVALYTPLIVGLVVGYAVTINKGVEVGEKLLICFNKEVILGLMEGLEDMLVDPEGDRDWLMDLLTETDARMEEDAPEEGDPMEVIEDEKLIVVEIDEDPL